MLYRIIIYICKVHKAQNININKMPVEFLYTDSEIIKLQRTLLFKTVLTKEDLQLLNEIHEYLTRK